MAPSGEKSSLKRGHPSVDSTTVPSEPKKPRRSHHSKSLDNSQLPSPLDTNQGSVNTEDLSDDVSSDDANPGIARSKTPPSQMIPSANNILSPRSHGPTSYSQFSPRRPRQTNAPSQFQPPSSPLSADGAMGDTQAFSQFLYPPNTSLAYEVDDEEEQGVWGYLIPVSIPSDMKIKPDKERELQEVLVLKRRAACPVPIRRVGRVANNGRLNGKDGRVDPQEYERQEDDYEAEKAEAGIPAGGYLIGRHPECDRIIPTPTISNRHCLIFEENKNGKTIGVIEDLSQNGTFVNEAVVGRNKRRELHDGDEVSILDLARFVFRYPSYIRNNAAPSHGFKAQYAVQEQLGKGHFASVYLCVERSSGMRYAVKHFTKRPGNLSASQERSRTEGLQQEIAVLKGVSHPALLCLKDTFDEEDGVYLVLELAPEGELFNTIVKRGKLTDADSRKLFVQLFQGVKYLHERNIVHRDIKPENILLVDQDLTVKLADFGLAKIIGEESFTTTLCGTPSYVAPEILTPTPQRRYTRAVDVWSLGVVLYIVLCGFPPFSDELCTPSNPYNLSQQIKMGRFDYPSPYWDDVGDEALDLIDRMLCVDVEKRISVEGCISHPWVTGENFTSWLRREYPHELDQGGQYAGWGTAGHQYLSADGSHKTSSLANLSMDSTNGLRSAMNALNFEKRKPHRERTLLSELNEVQLTKVIPVDAKPNPGQHLEEGRKGMQADVKVYEKNPGITKKKEAGPADGRDPEAFAVVGEKGDPVLYSAEKSRYADPEKKKRAEQITGKNELGKTI